ncbi:monovalent cation/H(+) antiporter subunit G [Rubritalea sp.]|uniref:monovalent cation/H(+) antiporter subunit G n=1 Tax=Rubritalea sp. TaxID=2109375 RepID=UPI003F4AE43E
MMTYIISFFLLTGSLFALLAAVGVVRMPDLYTRMHAATKAGAFGCALILIAVMLSIPTPRVIIESLAILFFFYLTAPIAAHLVGRISYRRHFPIWTAKNKKSEGE